MLVVYLFIYLVIGVYFTFLGGGLAAWLAFECGLSSESMDIAVHVGAILGFVTGVAIPACLDMRM